MNVEEVQRSLWEQSKTHKQHRESDLPLFPVNPYGRRIRNLMDLMHQPDWLHEACECVLSRSRGKAPGVDRVTAQKFSSGLEGKLEKLRLELKHGTYQPQPVRRVMIPKSNGKMRALGIPCLRDKIVQEAMRMALEPIFEVEFHDNSYGFRPNRSAHNAISRCQQLVMAKFTWVIEGDVKACFDEISHKAILKVLREKVMDNKFLSLTHSFLKAGVEIEGVVQPTEKGVPQGGVISPLLANAVLNKLDWFLHNKGTYGKVQRWQSRHGQPNVRFARYADDWCVFITRASKKYALRLREQIREHLKQESGLELSVEKTHVTHIREGIRFLGFRILAGKSRSGIIVPKIKIPIEAVTQVRRRLDEAMRYRPHQESIACRLNRGSAVVRGWSNYFRIAYNFYNVAGSLDHYAFWSATKSICRKLDINTAKCLKRYSIGNYIGLDMHCKLSQFSSTKIMPYGVLRPKEYEAGLGKYGTDMELEAYRFHEGRRQGSADLRFETLKRDRYKCCTCGRSLTARSAQVDHITPVKCFANVALASTPDNLQTLCLDCHKEKHRAR